MALSIIEIAEDDCKTVSSLKVKIISKNHIKTLIGKYFKKFESDINWVLLEKEDQVGTGDLIFVRSPIFCKTPDKKICKKCFGTRSFNTSYLGILAGQILSERFERGDFYEFREYPTLGRS